MNRERALKVVLVLVGLLFSAGIYPVTDSLWHANQSMYTEDMMISLYVNHFSGGDAAVVRGGTRDFLAAGDA